MLEGDDVTGKRRDGSTMLLSVIPGIGYVFRNLTSHEDWFSFPST